MELSKLRTRSLAGPVDVLRTSFFSLLGCVCNGPKKLETGHFNGRYILSGKGSMMTKHKSYNAELKLQVVLEVLKARKRWPRSAESMRWLRTWREISVMSSWSVLPRSLLILVPTARGHMTNCALQS